MHPTAPAILIATLMATPALAAPRVVTDLMPTAALVQAVMGDQGQVEVLLPQGASAHHHQMRPSDAQALQSADLLVWMGPGLTPWLTRAAQNLSAGDQLRLLEVPETALRSYATDEAHDHGAEAEAGHDHEHDHEHAHEHEHEHEDEHDHAEEDGHDHDGHDHGGSDPHAWLDPDNAILWLDVIATDLSRRDPEHAEAYRANADKAADRIRQMDGELTQMLAPHAQQSFVVFHDAYGYFTDHYGLRPGLAVSLGDASTPSAARMAAIRQQIADSGAHCAFPELAHDPALMDAAIEGSDVRLGGELNPEGATLSAGPDQYEALMTGMARTIADCLNAE